MLYTDATQTYLAYLKAERGLAPSTLKAYGPWLAHFDRFCDQLSIESRDLDARLNAHTAKRYLYECNARGFRPRTTRNAIVALRGFAKFCVEQGWIPADPTVGLVLPKRDAAARPVASDDDLTKLMSVVEHERNPRRRARERAMVYTLIMTGVRFSEWLALRVQDVDLTRKTLTVFQGKGSKSRTLYPPPDCLAAIAEWLVERRKMSCKHDWLWAYDPARRMGDKGSREMIEDLKSRAGLASIDAIKPHALRRAFATRLLRRGADIKVIQAALGHSEANTTFLYLAMHNLPAQGMAGLASLEAAPYAPPLPVQAEIQNLPAATTRQQPPSAPSAPSAPLGPRRADETHRMRRRPAR